MLGACWSRAAAGSPEKRVSSVILFRLPRTYGRCDPEHNPLGRGQGRKEVGDDMKLPQAGTACGVSREMALSGDGKTMSNAKWE